MLLLRCYGISSTLYLLAFVCLLLFVAACVRAVNSVVYFGAFLVALDLRCLVALVWLVCLLFGWFVCCFPLLLVVL